MEHRVAGFERSPALRRRAPPVRVPRGEHAGGVGVHVAGGPILLGAIGEGAHVVAGLERVGTGEHVPVDGAPQRHGVGVSEVAGELPGELPVGPASWRAAEVVAEVAFVHEGDQDPGVVEDVPFLRRDDLPD